MARSRQMTKITALHLQNQVLVEQDIAIVRAIGKVIDRKDARHPCALHALPPGIQRIMVDDKPVDSADRPIASIVCPASFAKSSTARRVGGPVAAAPQRGAQDRAAAGRHAPRVRSDGSGPRMGAQQEKHLARRPPIAGKLRHLIRCPIPISMEASTRTTTRCTAFIRLALDISNVCLWIRSTRHNHRAIRQSTNQPPMW